MNNMVSKVYVFCCATGYDKAAINRSINRRDLELKVILLPCSGKLDTLYLMKAFETGADGVAVMVCRQEECRYLEGNLRAKKRVEAVARLLGEIGMDRERISVIQLDNSDIEGAMKSLEAFCNRITGVSGNIITPELQTSNVG